MNNNHDDYQKRKIAFVGDYVPRKCGIATFTADLRNSVAARYPDVECLVVSVTDQEEGYDYPEEVRFEMKEEDLDGYKRAADFLNFNNVEMVSLQHEFGIYGGPSGEHILTLLRRLQMPVVTTLHTVLPKFDNERQQILEEIVDLSTRVVIMTERGQEFLEKDFGVSPQKIHLIPHGIPDMPFVDPNFYKDEFNVEGKTVLLTFGLLTQAKGIEYVLQALPDIVDKYPNLVYIVLGATHPELVRREGEAYRESLEAIVKELGLEQHVVFYNQFVPKEELLKYIGTADLYITPYLHREQITSGTLAYAFGCGKAVISTPYWYAEDLLVDNRGKLVPFKDAKAIAREMIYLLEHEAERHAMRKNAYLLGREMIWSEVAELYMRSFQEARLIRHPEPVAETDTNKVVRQQKSELPPLRLHQLFRLTDSIGIVRHSRFHIPYIRGGYCTDDNARGLVLTTRLQEMGQNETELRKNADTYAAFIQYAFEPEQQRFHSNLSFDRRWLDETDSDETQSRVIWALGTCVGRSTDPNLKKWATQLIDQVGPMGKELQTPLAWAFTLLGIHEYFRQLRGDRPLDQLRDLLVQRLLDMFNRNASDDWPWFEKTLS
jgi:glycosyltransferase involved in cell wall biosynthesis